METIFDGTVKFLVLIDTKEHTMHVDKDLRLKMTEDNEVFTINSYFKEEHIEMSFKKENTQIIKGYKCRSIEYKHNRVVFEW